MIKLDLAQKERVKAFAMEFKKKYLGTKQGRVHLESYKREKKDVKQRFGEIKKKFEIGEDITDDVLYGLLPYANTEYNRKQKHRVSTFPAITKDIKTWFENAGWQKKENWPKVAKAIFNLINGLVSDKDPNHIKEFTKSIYSKGFQSGIISPILYCLNEDFLIINNKNIDTVNFILEEDVIDRRLENYLQNIEVVKELLEKLEISMFDTYDKFDAFCHWMCDKRLGGYARVQDVEAPVSEIANHNDAIGILLNLGKILGYERYTAHPSGKYKDEKLEKLADLENVPHDFRSIKDINRIDVIWYDKHKPPSYLFQVDDKGDMKVALDRLYEARNINAKFFIVSPIRNKEKLERELERDPHRANKSMYRFLSFEDLAKLFESAEIYYKNKKELLD
jgi:hypothetical protein